MNQGRRRGEERLIHGLSGLQYLAGLGPRGPAFLFLPASAHFHFRIHCNATRPHCPFPASSPARPTWGSACLHGPAPESQIQIWIWMAWPAWTALRLLLIPRAAVNDRDAGPIQCLPSPHASRAAVQCQAARVSESKRVETTVPPLLASNVPYRALISLCRLTWST